MHSISLRGSAAALGVLLASAVAAQPVATPPAAQPAGRPDPLDARAAVPPVLHRSALASFRPALDVPVGSWKDANDNVTRIGGWRTYLREAAQPEAAAAPPAVTTPAAAVPPAPAAAPSAQPAPPARPAAGHHHHGKP